MNILLSSLSGQNQTQSLEFRSVLQRLGHNVCYLPTPTSISGSRPRFWIERGYADVVALEALIAEAPFLPDFFLYVEPRGLIPRGMEAAPDEVYHLAAQSFVTYFFEDEFSTLNTNINGTHYGLSALREVSPKARFYFAGSSEMFGESDVSPQDEHTPFQPCSAYGISKVAGFDLTKNYREAYGIHASNGIMFNHESPRGGFEFVTRKITSHVARIKAGLARELKLGNLDACRDWGHARDYVEAMWLMLQQDEPDDYVIATGETHTVREFLEIAFGHVGLNYREHIVVGAQLHRPAEVNLLLGNGAALDV